MIFSRVSLKYRIALSIFLLEAVMVLVVLSQTQSLTRSLTTEIQETNDQAMLDLLADLSRVALFTADFGELQQYIERVSASPHIETVLVSDLTGRVVLSSDFSNLGGPLPALVNSDESFWRTSEIPDLGRVAIQFSNKALIEATHQVQKLGYGIALSGMVIIAVAGILFGFILTRRLEVLAAASRRFAKGDLSTRCAMAGEDEVAMLGHTLDQMAEDITAHIGKLERQQVALRKAHDVLELRVADRTRDLVEKNQTLEYIQRQLQEEKAAQARLIAQLQDAQQQMVQSKKMAAIGHLAAGVAHEINNPIGYVKSNVSMLQRYSQDLLHLNSAYADLEEALRSHDGYPALRALKSQVDPEFLKQDIEDLVDETQQGLDRVKDIVQDLKDFSSLNNRDWQSACVHQCLESTLSMARHELKGKISVIRDFGDLPEIECLPQQLNQVFMNLLLNAVDAIEDAGVITLITRREGDKVAIDVQDSGRGIESAHLSDIFDPFFTTKAVGSGTGLGLSISYGIIERHQGSIEVTSKVGEGSVFSIRLPICQNAMAEAV